MSISNPHDQAAGSTVTPSLAAKDRGEKQQQHVSLSSSSWDVADREVVVGSAAPFVDKVAERSYVRKLDLYLLPMMSLSNLGNAKTDGMDKDLGFVGEQYSLLILLFYVPNGLCDLPLNMLTKRWSGKVMLPGLMLGWGSCALLQCAATNFAGMLVLRLFLGAFEAGFFAGAVFYLTLFYTRGELGFRIAIFFGSALLAAAFSGLISFGVFRIQHGSIQGWKWLFIIEGAMTVIIALVSFFWLPASSSTAWFLTPAEKAAALARSRRDAGTGAAAEAYDTGAMFRRWRSWQFAPWCAISFTYPVAFATTSNFLPQLVARVGGGGSSMSAVETNLRTVAPNAAGFCFLLAVAWSSDRLRERTFHIVFALCVSLAGLVVLAAVDAARRPAVAYAATFLLAAGAYIPSCLVHSWHNNNNLSENARAATTGLLVGLGNLGGILSAATFRTEYAPAYVPTLVATACCNVTCIVFTLGLGGWMKWENRRRDRLMGCRLSAGDVDTAELGEQGEKDVRWRYFT
ncbi:major facilitator superfamily transporter [Diplodia corticola]|uniref:Major facilitator superfamily transporter n=1 Tax=Diplodia corticola TaxID=236234 RepID=A0A1J9REA2_9PEZI|nr:major facilitator superfamily transporter [Diplodia corticola]OJD30883.1 major facilitator superfamily transporter [Diplodia corticola]